jgi:glycosyltransferase involved in cell wall biosynthesis
MSEENFFTIVIPTRERCDTLEHTLHTCLNQNYEKLEILISDNYSQDLTREVVESYKDSRISYINTGKRVSMSENYEFALSHVKPEGYVIYIGDDDGLLPNAIHDINLSINKTGAKVLRWDVASYFWPKFEGKQVNQLYIPSLKSHLSSRNSANAIRSVLSFEASYTCLPVMYMYSAIAYDVIKSIKKISGRFYHSLTPDIYSGFAIAGCVNNFVNSTRPYTIGGASHHSIGASGVGANSLKAVLIHLSETSIPCHPSLVQCFSDEHSVIESFLQARDHLPYFDGFRFEMEKLIFQMMIAAATRPEVIYMDVKNAVLRLGEMHNISDVAQKAIDANPNKRSEPAKKSILSRISRLTISKIHFYIKNKFGGSLSIDCSTFNVKNIYDASLLCGNILALHDDNMIKNPVNMKFVNTIKKMKVDLRK